MENRLHGLVSKCSQGISAGIASYCTANRVVIEACMEQALRYDDDVLIEATANQVNQYGGYTGMTPADFRDFVFSVADEVGFPRERILLGGDHLGPLVWQALPAEEAMERAKVLVRLFVSAGYQKIHLDTSMRLRGDPEKLPIETIAQRGAVLLCECQKAYQQTFANKQEAEPPVYIIGSEVPIPGGAQEKEETVEITKPEMLRATWEAYRAEFRRLKLDALRDVIGIVVQPGVEFGDNQVLSYNRTAARKLTMAVSDLHGVVLEGHSTDYQSPKQLREMVEDGIAILKVGPALTFALREGLFALSHMEKELIPLENRGNLMETLESLMLAEPQYWKKHYSGTEAEQKLKRKYSYSDRCRYYFSHPDFQRAMERLFQNINGIEIPMGLLHQFLPRQYRKVRDGLLPLRAETLVKDCVAERLEDYHYATCRSEICSGRNDSSDLK